MYPPPNQALKEHLQLPGGGGKDGQSAAAQSSLRFISPSSLLSSLSSHLDYGHMSHLVRGKIVLSGPQLVHPRAAAVPALPEDIDPMKWVSGTCISYTTSVRLKNTVIPTY